MSYIIIMAKKGIVVEEKTGVLFNEIRGIVIRKNPTIKATDNNIIEVICKYYKEKEG